MTPSEVYFEALKAGKRLPELEDIIMKDTWFSCIYAQHVIEGRWIEAEDIIMTDPDPATYYSREVIKGRLPEKMHNMMILYAIKDPDNIDVKDYFEFIK